MTIRISPLYARTITLNLDLEYVKFFECWSRTVAVYSSGYDDITQSEPFMSSLTLLRGRYLICLEACN